MEFEHELIIPNEGLPFKLFPFEGGSGNYMREKHWHTSIEVFAVMEGRLSLFLNEEEHPLRAGEVIIINSNQMHSIRALEQNKTMVLQIPLKQFGDYFTAERFIRFSSVGNEKNPELVRRIKELSKAQREQELGWEFRARAVYNEIMYLLVSAYRVTEVREKDIIRSRRLDALSKITTYMREHYREELKLSQLAAMFGYSEAYLSRMFRRYAKVNFKSYLQDIRMAYAYRELMNTDHTISRIALDNGFCSSRGFSGDFQKRYGILPSEAVRRKKEKGQKSAMD